MYTPKHPLQTASSTVATSMLSGGTLTLLAR